MYASKKRHWAKESKNKLKWNHHSDLSLLFSNTFILNMKGNYCIHFKKNMFDFALSCVSLLAASPFLFQL